MLRHFLKITIKFKGLIITELIVTVNLVPMYRALTFKKMCLQLLKLKLLIILEAKNMSR